MSLRVGARLGSYEILSLLGSGGMGEVYRALDTRLRREVAIKILPEAFTSDGERLARFEREARMLAALNHPNIGAIYGLVEADGLLGLVLELVEGKTLADRLRSGGLHTDEAIVIGRQIAEALDAAHEKGIIHRDLKPANIKVTPESTVKVLDFGLAKAPADDRGGPDLSQLTTMTAGGSRECIILGTPGYMSPEQARGKLLDKRTDIWSFGCVIYELLCGRPAFTGETLSDTLAAILEREPDWRALPATAPASVRGLIRRCLEKDPKRRLRDIGDAQMELESALAGPEVVSAAAGRPDWSRLLIWIAIATASLAAGFYWGHGGRDVATPSFVPVTFQRGVVSTARFAPDGRTVVYDAQWNGEISDVFVASPPSPEARPFGLTGARLLAVCASGEMAIRRPDATLATTVISGRRAPRDLLADVAAADWSADGTRLAVARSPKFGTIEYPIGKTIYRGIGILGSIRVARSGDRIVFINHPQIGLTGGVIGMVMLTGEIRTLSSGWDDVSGLALSPDGAEVWFTGTKAGAQPALYAVSWSGVLRTIAEFPGPMVLHDVSVDRRVLLSRDEKRADMMVSIAGDPRERNLSWLSNTQPRALSPDGRMVLFDDIGDASGAGHSIYLGRTAGSPPIRVGDGSPLGYQRTAGGWWQW